MRRSLEGMFRKTVNEMRKKCTDYCCNFLFCETLINIPFV